MSKVRLKIILALTVIFWGAVAGLISLSGCASGVDLSVYARTDFSFLADFDYGKIKKSEAAIIFDTAQELVESDDEKLAEGNYVRTEGYYLADDLGGASYIISKTSAVGSLNLKNGLYANLVPDKCILNDVFYVINAKQFGAKADGETAAQTAINDAFAYIADNLGGKKTILYLPKGEYRVDNEINANKIKNVIFTGAGSDTLIFTDNGYKSWWEFFFACWEDENCFFGNFKIQARESWGQNRYYRQMTLIYCNNCYLYNLTLDVPETAWNGELFDKVDSKGEVVEPNSFDKQYTNLTMYSGDKNITVDSCTMYQMSGTYRGANIGIMDFYETGTENITVKNCELHDNARDEQVGIFSKSGAPNSRVSGVNFLNNKVYTHMTPYRDIIGPRTMCFTVAYDNRISNINIEGNEFVSYADSKFMTFGSVKNCTVKNNKITVIASNGNGGYVFDSAAALDGDVVIEDNECYFTYRTTPMEGKCVSAGHITFRNNNAVADCTVYKISDRLGVYERNDFKMFGPFGSCGSATKFNRNNVTCFSEHSNAYNEIFFNHTADPALDENTVLEFVGNTVTDYTYFYGDRQSQKVFDKLCAINNMTVRELRITDNVYNCPNYSYIKPDDYIWICWVRSGATVKNFVCKNNNLQGAKVCYGAEGGNNTLREFNNDIAEPQFTEIKILHGGEVKDKIATDATSVTLTVEGADDVEWFALENGATVENGVVRREGGGTVTVFAAKKDGSGIYTKITVTVAGEKPRVALAVFLVILAVGLALGAVAFTVLFFCKRELLIENINRVYKRK